MGEGLDLLGERGREHQRLPLRRHGFDDAADRGEEAHVEHPVGLVEHEELEPGEIAAAAAHQVQQPTRAGDHDVGAGPERAHLRSLADAPEDGRDAQRKMLGVGADVLLDLHDQLAGRREHEHARSPASAGGEHRRQPGEDGQREGRGLPGAGLGDADEIAARDDRRDGSGLDGRGFGVTRFLDGFEDLGIEPELLERHSECILRLRPGIARL